MGNPAIVIRRQASSPITPDLQRVLSRLLREMRYGTLTLVVQDGIVLQINTTEKSRFKDALPVGS